MAAYWTILRRPGVLRVVATAFVARMSFAMAPLAVLLLVHEETGSYAIAGWVLGAQTLAFALTAIVLGRLADRIGYGRVIGCAAVANAVALTSIAALGAELPFPALLLVAALWGGSTPPISGCIRALWPDLVPPGPALQRAFALESVTQEAYCLLGVLCVAGLLTVTTPRLT